MWQHPLDAGLPDVSRHPDPDESPGPEPRETPRRLEPQHGEPERREPQRRERPRLEAVPPLAQPAPRLWELHLPATPARRLSFFRRRFFLFVSEEPIGAARSLQWCLGWVTGIVTGSAAIVAVGFQTLSPPALLGLLACQFATVAAVLYLLGDAERRHQPPERTTTVTFGTALAAVAASTEGGIAILAGSLAGLAHWTGSALDPVRGLLLLIVVGLVGLVTLVLGVSWAMARVAQNLRLQPGEKATLLLEAVALMAVSFVVLVAW